MRADLLHVIAVIDNPIRWVSRIKLFKAFAQHMLDSGVQLTVVECAHGDRPFECFTPGANNVQVRSKTILWTKENLQNIGLSRLPVGWKYVATLDADIAFRKKGWAAEIVHALQQYDALQPWDIAYDLGPNDDHLGCHRSLMSLYCSGKPVVQGPNAVSCYEFGHPGYAWAWTRDALERVGGFLETAILGAADHHMGMGLIGKAADTIHAGVTQEYKNDVMRWQELALFHVNKNVGFVPNTIEHMWHGKKERRFYVDRWQILVDSQYDPRRDIKKNTFGVIELTGNKPQLRADIDRYMRSRDEDGNSLS